MTYKNTKFDQSPVMRSLERLAVKKGLIKPDEIKKTASKKSLDLTPGPNFEENILKLCAGLRNAGLTKQAVEVETKFFNLKKAVHLYDTHGETGDDVIDAAHPDGSHQMKNLDGDAMVETIIDKHKAMTNMIAKEPTGKLANAKKLAGMVKSAGKMSNNLAINAVMLALGQKSGNLDALYSEATSAATKFSQVLNVLNKKIENNFANQDNIFLNRGFQSAADFFAKLNQILSGHKVHDKFYGFSRVGDEKLSDQLSNIIEKYKSDEGPSWFSTAEYKDKWENEILPGIELAEKYAGAFKAAVDEINTVEAEQTKSHATNEFDQDKKPDAAGPQGLAELQNEFQSLAALADNYKTQITSKRYPNADKMIAFINSMITYINNQQSAFNALPNKETAINEYTQKMETVKNRMSNFASKALAGA